MYQSALQVQVGSHVLTRIIASVTPHQQSVRYLNNLGTAGCDHWAQLPTLPLIPTPPPLPRPRSAPAPMWRIRWQLWWLSHLNCIHHLAALRWMLIVTSAATKWFLFVVFAFECWLYSKSISMILRITIYLPQSWLCIHAAAGLLGRIGDQTVSREGEYLCPEGL